ncbi:MAG: HAD family hydrolase [Candidatus Hydrogenedentes bacterium]|nr:HAD family hydrolase [Candidatus Hydrogenedentota bacterium]
MPVRAITFDFWNTLFRDCHSAERWQMRAAAFGQAAGVPVDDVAEALKSVAAEFFRSHHEDQRTLGPEDGVRIVCEFLGVRLDPGPARAVADVFATAILELGPEPIEGALDAVRAAAQVVPAGIVSDSGISPGRSLKGLLARHGFLEHLEVLVFSDEVGVAKPQAPMFETAAAGLGVTPDALLHIGDLEWSDIAGARAIGATAALFAGANDRYRDCTEADHTFTSWPEFIEALPGLVA